MSSSEFNWAELTPNVLGPGHTVADLAGQVRSMFAAGMDVSEVATRLQHLDISTRFGVASSIAESDQHRGLWLMIDLLAAMNDEWRIRGISRHSLYEVIEPWLEEHGSREHLEELERRSLGERIAAVIRHRLWHEGKVAEHEWLLDGFGKTIHAHHLREAMLTYLDGKTTQRKLRLFAVACCRRALGRSWDDRLGRAVAVAERYADGDAQEEELRAARQPLLDSVNGDGEEIPFDTAGWYTCMDILCGLDVESVAWDIAERPGEDAAQVALVRDIFGNPFRPPALKGQWICPSVLAVAGAIYDGRAFESLPILGDALTDAGCDEEAILSHCRAGGEHVRGCWVVDLVLAKE